jgi:hypothetical protein
LTIPVPGPIPRVVSNKSFGTSQVSWSEPPGVMVVPCQVHEVQLGNVRDAAGYALQAGAPRTVTLTRVVKSKLGVQDVTEVHGSWLGVSGFRFQLPVRV